MNSKTTDIVKASIFLAFGLLIPYIFHITGVAGSIFLPMHIPVLLCGFFLGPRYGLIIGIITPLLNAILTGMPPIYPTAVAMAFELATYGWTAGWLYGNKNKNILLALITAMLLGRIVLGAANYILLGFMGKKYVLQMFLASAFIKSIWGIIIQLVLIPIIIKAIEIKKQKEWVG